MSKKEITTHEDLIEVLNLMDKTGICYWLDGGWGVDVLVGKQTRTHRDIDIDFDSKYTGKLLEILKQYGYEVITDWSPVRVELYHSNLGYIDIHPFIIIDGENIKQADLDGNFYEFEKDYFGNTIFEGRNIPCISIKGQRVFHTGY